jgi:uncharacterized protein DUF6869
MEREVLLRDWLANLESDCADTGTNEAFTIASFLSPPEDSEWAWGILLEGLRRARSESVIGLIGASSLENLLIHDGVGTLSRVTEALPREPALRVALRHVWPSSMEESVWRRVQELQAGGQ